MSRTSSTFGLPAATPHGRAMLGAALLGPRGASSLDEAARGAVASVRPEAPSAPGVGVSQALAHIAAAKHLTLNALAPTAANLAATGHLLAPRSERRRLLAPDGAGPAGNPGEQFRYRACQFEGFAAARHPMLVRVGGLQDDGGPCRQARGEVQHRSVHLFDDPLRRPICG